MKKTATSLLVVMSGIIAAGLLMVSGVGQMAFAAQSTSAGAAQASSTGGSSNSNAAGDGSASTGTGSATATVTVPLLGTIVSVPGEGTSSTGSVGTTHAGGGLLAACSGTIPPITVGGGCSSAP